jgi:hypothetical protein
MEYKKISEIKLLENNPRTISDRQFKILCTSIKKNIDYFEARPLILSDRTGELVVIAGNQRYKAAESLGLKEVPTYLMKNLTEETEREIVIRDNISNGDWDFDLLANEWNNGEKADMVFTDPPYGVDYEGINNDDRGGLEDLLRGAFSNMMVSTNNGGSFYCFHSDKCSDIFSKIYREFCHFSSMIIWAKESIVLSQTDYQSKHEPCMYGWFDNGTHKWYSDRKQESVWIAKSKREEGHTTPKPIEIITKALNNSSKVNHLILDLFLGSGSTMVASHFKNQRQKQRLY